MMIPVPDISTLVAIDKATNFDPAKEADNIFCEHTTNMVSGIHAEYDDTQHMLDCTTEECSFILVKRFEEGKYTPMQFAAVRNALADLLWKLFGPTIEAEDKAKVTEAVISEIRMYMQ